jgi:hypothetical protein
LIFRIEQAAKSPYPASLFDAAASTRYAIMFNLSKKETRHLDRHLHGLVRKANTLIQDAFPMIRSQGSSSSSANMDDEANDEASDEASDVASYETFAPYTTDRAHCDVHRSGYSTYLRVPNSLPWHVEDQAIVESEGDGTDLLGISVADVAPEWIETLKEHYGISA